MPRQPGITAQQDQFIAAYLASPDFNATQAAIHAGYSPKSATSTASKLLSTPWIREKIDSLLEERKKSTISKRIMSWINWRASGLPLM